MAGLAEIAEEQDAGLFKRLLSHEFPSRRAAAIRGLRTIFKEKAAELFTRCLEDDNPQFLRAIRNYYREFPGQINKDTCLRIANGSQSLPARKNAIKMISDLPKWQSIACLLTVISQAEDEISDVAITQLRRWLQNNRNFTVPTNHETEQLNRFVESPPDRLPSDLKQAVTTILDYYSK